MNSETGYTKALIFLVISCPCALVISIPLGYFMAELVPEVKRNPFKGSNFLDALANIQNVVMDKTGTMTEVYSKYKQQILKTDLIKMKF